MRRIAGAVYLSEHGRPAEALDILQAAIAADNPFACSSAVECDIRRGNCTTTGERLSSIELNDSTQAEVRLALAQAQAMFVLECKREDLKGGVLAQLEKLKKLKRWPHVVDHLPDALVAGKYPKGLYPLRRATPSSQSVTTKIGWHSEAGGRGARSWDIAYGGVLEVN
jgi:hypothetical protein